MKYCIINKRSLIVIMSVAMIVVAAIVVAVASATAAPASSTSKQLPIYCTKQDKKIASLSFDAAWGNEDTQQLIDILGKYKVKATFFVVGQWVDKFPESVKALADAGHEIMNHSDTHPHMPNLSRDEMAAQLKNCNDKIEKITGKRPILFRAPYGDYDNAMLDVVKSQGMYCIQWDVDSLDWKDKTADEITQRVTSKVQPGSICLFHNAAKHTPAALPSLIEKLQADGYTLVPISQQIYKENYTIDVEGRQIPQTGLLTTPSTTASGTTMSTTSKSN